MNKLKLNSYVVPLVLSQILGLVILDPDTKLSLRAWKNRVEYVFVPSRFIMYRVCA